MAKFPKPAANPPRQSPAPAPTTPTNITTRLPFLKAADLNADRSTGLLITRPIRLYTGGQFGQQLILACILENEKAFDWSIKIGGQQHVRLEKKLGKDLCAWPDRVINVVRERFNDHDYVAVEES